MSNRTKILSKKKQKKRLRKLDRAWKEEVARRYRDRLAGREYD